MSIDIWYNVTSKHMQNPLAFLKETRDELNKVTWPTQQEVVRLTVVVVLVSLLVGVFIGSVDFVLTKLTEDLIK